ncbi:MAG: DUF2304 domain-containing protein [Bryobacterales bacterium]|nr:DUF2304 domain-containing protein [Bryobacteraceae bacterium]MDW8355413.1 DUF2304 domain-containing protein [Bryobacterales bacterium]
MDRLTNFMTGFSLLLILLVLRSVRRAHIRVEYSVSWLSAALVLLAISRSPWALEQIAALTGIADAPLALVFAVGCLFLIVFYRFSIVISDLKDANIALAQRVAILEYRLYEGHGRRQSQAAR